jgi:hypothetical protein
MANATPINRAALTKAIVKAISLGMTPKQTLKVYRECGGHIRTQEFNRLWRIVADSPRAYGMQGIRKNG